MNGEENVAIGIDLGTYNSAATTSLGDDPVMLKAREGLTDQGICFPSFVEFDEDGEFLRAGEYARRAMPVNPERVVWGVKRLIGKSYNEVKKAGDLERFQYKIVEGKDGSCRIKVGRREYSPTQISSLVLAKIKQDAEAAFNPIGCPVTEATITVPAYFGPFQRAETEQAARVAGFAKVHLIPEPTAAALAHRLKVEKQNQFITVIDLGAGTLDVTVALLYLDKEGTLQTAEKGHGGDTALGGLDIDDLIMQDVVNRNHLQGVLRDSHGRARLREQVERAKIELSEKQETRVSFPYAKGNVDIVVRRSEIEAAIRPILERCRGPIQIALREASLQAQDMSHVLLVGGPTKMPPVRALVAAEFAGNPQIAREIAGLAVKGFPVDPMEAVARGAIMGAFGGITPHAYGVILDGAYYELIPRRTRYPCSNTTAHLLPGKRRSISLNLIQKAVDPQSFQEVYMMLGIFQFDYRPESNSTSVQIEAEYTQNGVLNLQIVQPSTMVSLPLYNVSKLEGRKVTKPSTPLPIAPPTYREPPPSSNQGYGGPAQPADHGAVWSQNELQDAIRAGNRLLPIVDARLGQANAEDAARLEALANDLRQWISNSWEDINARTPQIRNLTRALLTILLTNHLIDIQEARSLPGGMD